MAAIVCSAAKMFNGDDVKILPIVGTTRLIIHLYAIHRVLHLATPLGHSFMSPLATIPWAQSAVGGPDGISNHGIQGANQDHQPGEDDPSKRQLQGGEMIVGQWIPQSQRQKY